MKNIMIVSTLNTKWQETYYLRDKIKGLGKKPIILDISMRLAGDTVAVCDIPPQKVAEAGGCSFDDILVCQDRSKNTAIMTKGASNIALEYVE